MNHTRKIISMLVFTFSLISMGCVERAMVITSEPSGADVVVNQQWEGKTPFVLPFRNYGTYDIRINHPGIEESGKTVRFYPLNVAEPIIAPGYQKPGVDLVSEALVPTTIRDTRELHYKLERIETADETADILARAERLKQSSIEKGRARAEKDVNRKVLVSKAPLLKTKKPVPKKEPVNYSEETQFVEDDVVRENVYYISEAGERKYIYDDDEIYTEVDLTPPMPDELPIFN